MPSRAIVCRSVSSGMCSTLGEIGMSFDLCLRPSELGDAVGLVDQCPDTRFIVDHCGNADPADRQWCG